MKLLALEHVLALAVLAMATVAACIAARKLPSRQVDLICKTSAVVLVVIESSWWFVYLPLQHSWAPAYGLPLQLCDVAGYIAAAALWWRQWLLVELTYFWGVGGTLQALLTPDLKQAFPSYPYWQFYVTHGLIVVAAFLLVVGVGLTPRKNAVVRTFLITVGFTLFIGLVDILTGGNYMYLREPPTSGSLLNYMGPWPWYLLSGTGVALVVLAILDAPFWGRPRQRIALQ